MNELPLLTVSVNAKSNKLRPVVEYSVEHQQKGVDKSSIFCSEKRHANEKYNKNYIYMVSLCSYFIKL